MNGLDLVRRTYRRLRNPSQAALPWKYALEAVSEVIARKKLDLALSDQNSIATVSEWFTPTGNDIVLDELGLDGGVLLPIRVERRSIGSDSEMGDDLDIVNFEVLDTSRTGAISFYGDPLRMAFADSVDFVTNNEFRLVYESDFGDENELSIVVGLPEYFKSSVVLEASFKLLDQVEDDSEAFQKFYDRVSKKWLAEILDERQQWDKYVRRFKGRAAVPKRTFWERRNRGSVII